MLRFNNKGGIIYPSQIKRPSRLRRGKQVEQESQFVTECYCPNGHSLMSDTHDFDGLPGVTIRLKGNESEGLLTLSPLLGDKTRAFVDYQATDGELVEISCPSCLVVLPAYNQCFCGGDLIALFCTPDAKYSNCIGICQRSGCLHADIKSNRDLRLYSRKGFF